MVVTGLTWNFSPLLPWLWLYFLAKERLVWHTHFWRWLIQLWISQYHQCLWMMDPGFREGRTPWAWEPCSSQLSYHFLKPNSDWNWREYVPAPMPYLNIQWAWEAGDKFALDAGTMIHQSNFSAPSSHVLRVIRWMARPAVSGSTVSRFLKKLNLWHQDIPRAIGAL